MKKYTLFLLFNLAFAATLPAQDYEPLTKEGAVWQFFLSSSQLGGDVPYGYRIGGDTLLQGKQYRKLYFLDLYSEELWDHPADEDYLLEGEQLIGALRDDTTARQVFFLDFGHPYYDSWCDSTAEQLILDFNYELGDTIHGLCTTFKTVEEELLPCITDSIYTSFVHGKERRVIRCTGMAQGGFFEYLIEGIGFSTGPFAFGKHYIVITKGGHYLHRYCAPDIAESCDLLTSTAAPPAQEGGLLLYPNPFSDALNFDVPEGAVLDGDWVALLDANGRLLKRMPLKAANTTRWGDGLPTGLYWVRWTRDGQVIDVQRIVKMD